MINCLRKTCGPFGHSFYIETVARAGVDCSYCGYFFFLEPCWRCRKCHRYYKVGVFYDGHEEREKVNNLLNKPFTLRQILNIDKN